MKKNKKSFNQALTLTSIFLLIPIFSVAGEEATIRQPIGASTTITSNRVEMDSNDTFNIFRFYENVHVEGDNLEALCDELEVISKKTEGQQSTLGGMDSLEKVTATGNVLIKQIDRTIKAGHAVLYPVEGKVVLTQNPEVIGTQGTVRGHKIIFYKDDGKAYVEGGPDGERPKIVLSNLPDLKKDNSMKEKQVENNQIQNLTDNKNKLKKEF